MSEQTEAVGEIPEIALAWLREGHQVALATVIETWGSAPRRTGAQLAIRDDGTFMGSVSGGCVEGAVVLEAEEAMRDGRPRLLSFGVADEDAFAVGLACGGTIRVLVEPVGQGQGIPTALLEELVARRARREPVAQVTDLESWERELLAPGQAPELEANFRLDRSELRGSRFIAVHNPPLRLVIVGAGHIAQALVQLARLLGLDPVIVDPREAFASPERFPGETLIHDWPDEALEALAPDARTAVVTLAHDPKIDDPSLLRALRSPAFYVAALGSVRTHAKRVSRLREQGLDEAEIARIHAPAGLDIGAASPAEIALSIAAEMTARLRKG